MTHTPGPWTHHPEDNIITDASGRRLIEWQARSLEVSTAERDANAALVASAPALLAALREACIAHHSTNGTKPPKAWLLAVAKAEGRL